MLSLKKNSFYHYLSYVTFKLHNWLIVSCVAFVGSMLFQLPYRGIFGIFRHTMRMLRLKIIIVVKIWWKCPSKSYKAEQYGIWKNMTISILNKKNINKLLVLSITLIKCWFTMKPLFDIQKIIIFWNVVVEDKKSVKSSFSFEIIGQPSDLPWWVVPNYLNSSFS